MLKSEDVYEKKSTSNRSENAYYQIFNSIKHYEKKFLRKFLKTDFQVTDKIYIIISNFTQILRTKCVFEIDFRNAFAYTSEGVDFLFSVNIVTNIFDKKKTEMIKKK